MHIRQDFFDDLLSGKLHSADEVASIAGMHNMDAEGTYLCLAAKLDSAVQGTANYVEMQDAFLRIKDSMIAQIGEFSRRWTQLYLHSPRQSDHHLFAACPHRGG